MAATQTPQHHHLAEEENGDDDDMTNGDNGSGGGDVSRDLDTDEHIKDPIEDRRTLAERNERLHDQLKVILTAFLDINVGNHVSYILFVGIETRFSSVT